MHADLLKQSRQLAEQDPTRPKQANLRRAVWSGYYSLYHLLIHEAARHMIRGEGQTRLRQGLQRAFTHADVKRASNAIASGGIPAALGTITVPPDLKSVAQAVVHLQTARHDADYDLSQAFSRTQVIDLIEEAEDAFAAWRRVKDQGAARLCLVLLLAYGHLTSR